MAVTQKDTSSFTPTIESAVLTTDTKETNITMVRGMDRVKKNDFYEITQGTGKIRIPKKKLKEFGQELIDIAETYSGTWNAEMFR